MGVSSPCHRVAGLIVRAGWMSVCSKSRKICRYRSRGGTFAPEWVATMARNAMLARFLFRYTLKKWQLSPGMVATIRRNGWQPSAGMVATLRRNPHNCIEIFGQHKNALGESCAQTKPTPVIAISEQFL